MMEGLSSRAYESDTICKGGHELMPGERPRAPYRYEDVTDCCPKCGVRTGYVHTSTYFGCRYCGTHLYAEIQPTMPMTPDMIRGDAFVQYGGNPLVDAVCEKCGARYRTHAKHPARTCSRCRQARYRKNCKARKKSRLAASSDERAAGMLTQLTGHYTRKEGHQQL